MRLTEEGWYVMITFAIRVLRQVKVRGAKEGYQLPILSCLPLFGWQQHEKEKKLVK